MEDDSQALYHQWSLEQQQREEIMLEEKVRLQLAELKKREQAEHRAKMELVMAKIRLRRQQQKKQINETKEASDA